MLDNQEYAHRASIAMPFRKFPDLIYAGSQFMKTGGLCNHGDISLAAVAPSIMEGLHTLKPGRIK